MCKHDARFKGQIRGKEACYACELERVLVLVRRARSLLVGGDVAVDSLAASQLLEQAENPK